MIVGRLDLHPIAGRLATVVTFSDQWRGLGRSRFEPVLYSRQAVIIVAGRREFGAIEEFARRMDFRRSNRRSGMDSALQFFDQPFSLPLVLFGRHVVVIETLSRLAMPTTVRFRAQSGERGIIRKPRKQW